MTSKSRKNIKQVDIVKKRIAAALIAAMMVGTVITGCGTDAETEAPAVQSTVAAAEQAPEAEEAKEDRHILGRYVSGIDNRAVLEGAKSIDYLIKAESMKNVVTRIDVDDSAVDTAKPGTYKVSYTVTVNVENLEKAEGYIEEHPEVLAPAETPEQAPVSVQEQEPTEGTSNPAETVTSADEKGPDKETQAEIPADGTEEQQTQAPSAVPVLPNIPDEVFEDPTSSESGNPSKTEEIVIEKDVTVVTPEEAIEIINGGGEVWTDGSTPVTAEDLTGGDSSQAATTKPAAVTEPADNRDKEQGQAESSQPDGSDDGQDPSGSGNQSSGDSHVHNWAERTETVTHEETGHYESVKVGTKTVVDQEAWDEPVYEELAVCDACGYTSSSTEDINNHLYDHYDPELGYVDAGYSVKNVQVDTIHHSAVTHEEPVYEDKWVVDSEAWSEKKIVGYYCTECGATK